MAKSKQTFNKRQNEVKRQQKKRAKEEKKLQRAEEKQKRKPLNDMLAYVDENGNLTDIPPTQVPAPATGKVKIQRPLHR